MSYTIGQLEIGQKAQFSKTISESDVYMFAGVTGDMNPAHLNAEYAKDGLFHVLPEVGRAHQSRCLPEICIRHSQKKPTQGRSILPDYIRL